MARPEGPLVVCVINLKGGVGKSTIAALLARRAYVHRQKDVLAIDIDPQANLSQALMRSQYNNFLVNKTPSIVEVFAGYKPPSSAKSGTSGLGEGIAKLQAAECDLSVEEQQLARYYLDRIGDLQAFFQFAQLALQAVLGSEKALDFDAITKIEIE